MCEEERGNGLFSGEGKMRVRGAAIDEMDKSLVEVIFI